MLKRVQIYNNKTEFPRQKPNSEVFEIYYIYIYSQARHIYFERITLA